MSEEEEFEFRARAEAEQAQAQATAQQTQQAAPGAVPGQGPGPVNPSMMDQAGNFITQQAIPVAFGVGKAGYDLAVANPTLAAGAASYVPGLNKLPGLNTIKTGREAVMNILNRLATPPTAAPTPGAPASPIGAQQAAQQTARQSMADKVRQMAMNRVTGMAASGAAVPAGVALGGAAATGIAGGQMAAMTPEQRRAYYDSMMMGAMSGDAGLAAAIMNRGQ